MQIIDYKYIHGDSIRDGIVHIPELDRTKPATPQFIELANLHIRLEKPTALICIESTCVHQSEAGLTKCEGGYQPAIKQIGPYIAHQWASQCENQHLITSLSVTSGSCASAVQAIYEAQRALFNPNSLCEEVIIIGHERITPDTQRLFKEIGMKNLLLGDGFVYMRLGHGYEISHPQWKWSYDPNPFFFSREDLDTLLPHYRLGYVKLHGTGTPSNTRAEAGLEAAATPLRYKDTLGHTQGISALLETCLILDDPKIRGRILVTANGLGGYYGAFTLTKPNARNT